MIVKAVTSEWLAFGTESHQGLAGASGVWLCGETESCLGSYLNKPSVGLVAQLAVTAEQGSTQGLRQRSCLLRAPWHLPGPYHFRNLRTPSEEPWQLGWGVAGRGGCSSDGPPSAADDMWPGAFVALLWNAFKERELCDKIIFCWLFGGAFCSWKGNSLVSSKFSKVQKYPVQFCHTPQSWGRWGNKVVMCSIFFPPEK